MRHIRPLLCIILTFCGCSHAFQPVVHSVGMMGYQPALSRPVICVTDEHLSMDQCATLKEVVLDINHLAGQELFHWVGTVANEEAALAAFKHGTMLLYGSARLEEGVLGVTANQILPTGEIHRQAIAFNPSIWDDIDVDARAVAYHELFHALGFSHSQYADSIMNPNFNWHLRPSASDITSLRAAYPCK